MADIRITTGSPPAAPGSRPVEAGRSAAQRAFFAAAVGAAPAAAPAQPATALTWTAQPPKPGPTRVVETPAAEPTGPRYLRPGSLLDIKV